MLFDIGLTPLNATLSYTVKRSKAFLKFMIFLDSGVVWVVLGEE